MNRAERRAVGWRGPAFMRRQGDIRPRYVRRHAVATVNALMTGNATRRVRKARARMDQHAERMGF